ncbi:MAG: hypothetical protein RL303_1361 [Verrucomicrobiota bacterium]|jgi:hypothetical protein
MTLRFTFLLALLAAATTTLPAQSSLFGKKIPKGGMEEVEPAPAPTPPPATTKTPDAKTPTPAPTPTPVDEESDEDGVSIAPFRPATLPTAKTTRTFQLAKLNRLGATETPRELQRLYSIFATQRIVDGSPAGSSKAIGFLTSINYLLVQDFGDNRFLAKCSWVAAGPADALPAGTDTMAVLLLEKPAKVGDTGKITGMHAGTVSLSFKAEYAPLTGRRLTLRREAFLECNRLEDSPAGLRRFVEGILAGADFRVLTLEQTSCKACGGLGFTREPQRGKLLDKHISCEECNATGKQALFVETKFIP